MVKAVLPLGSGSNNKKVSSGGTQKNITFNLYDGTNKVKRYPIPSAIATAIHSKIPKPLNISLLVFIFLGIRYINTTSFQNYYLPQDLNYSCIDF